MDISGSDLALLGQLNLNSPSFSGGIKQLQLDKKNNLEFIENLKVTMNELHHWPLNYKLQNLSINIDLAEEFGALDLDITRVLDGDKETFASNLEVAASSTSLNFRDWDRITLKMDSALLPDLPFLDEDSSLENFSAILKKNPSNEFGVSGEGSFGDLELINKGDFIVNLSGTHFIFESSMSSQNELNDFLKSRVILKSKSLPVVSFDGEFTASVSGDDRLACLKNAECLSEIQSKYKFDIEGNQLTGMFSCQLSNCQERGLKHVIKSENTDMFFESAIKSQIFNPFALAVFYTNLSSGQKTGNGHLLKF